MTINVILGMWKNAPFQGSIISSVERLNEFLKSADIDMKYDIMPLALKELSKNKILPDVFIFDGGEDVDPSRYDEENRNSYFSKTRDEIEFSFAKFMANNGVKMCGICRGHQLLNVFLGGTLYQDIRRDGCVPQGIPHRSGHKVKVPRKQRSQLTKQLELEDFVGLHAFSASSLHHQSINHFGKNVVPSLIWEQYKDTGRGRMVGYVVEGIETVDSMVRGVQSHPEFKGYAKDGLLFAYLMFVDHFSTPLTEISDDVIVKKFSNLIKNKKVKIAASKNNYVNMSKSRDAGLPPRQERPPGLRRLRTTYTSSNRNREVTEDIIEDMARELSEDNRNRD